MFVMFSSPAETKIFPPYRVVQRKDSSGQGAYQYGIHTECKNKWI